MQMRKKHPEIKNAYRRNPCYLLHNILHIYYYYYLICLFNFHQMVCFLIALLWSKQT